MDVNEAGRDVAVVTLNLDHAPGFGRGEVRLYGGDAARCATEVPLTVDVLARVQDMASYEKSLKGPRDAPCPETFFVISG